MPTPADHTLRPLAKHGFSHAIIEALTDGPASFPAKPAVYALFSANFTPILLATTADLRAAVARRLWPANTALAPKTTTPDSPDSAITTETKSPKPGPQIDYLSLTHSISYLPVGSGFWANWRYSQAARELYPKRYQRMLGWKPAWFISINPQAAAPFFHIGTKIFNASTLTFGPIAGRNNAQTLVHEITDLFDLCRYEDILHQTPHGRACAYKEMAKCPAPCDGSVSMTEYSIGLIAAIQLLNQWSAGSADSPHVATRQTLENAMRAAAARLDFRQAGKCRDKLKKLDELSIAGLNHLVPMNAWGYLAFLPGKTSRWIEPHVISPYGIWRLAQVRTTDFQSANKEFCDRWLQMAANCFTKATSMEIAVEVSDNAGENPKDGKISPAEFSPVANPEEVVSLVCYHLFRTRDPGLYISRQKLTDAAGLAQRITHWLEKEKSPANRAGGVLEQSNQEKPEISTNENDGGLAAPDEA